MLTVDELMAKRCILIREDKLAAVRKAYEQRLSCCQVAPDLGIRDSLIHNWRRAIEKDGTLAAEVQNSPAMETEHKHLQEEFRQLRIEKDISKKQTPSLA